jgi:5-methylcytosine-specific restriction endonuclease McrA
MGENSVILGPGKLEKEKIRAIIKRPEYKSILKRYARRKIAWGDKPLAEVKSKIRLKLRELQDGRCVFCRRRIKIERRNAYEDIEHYLDKSKSAYYKWSFSCINLSLACHACNLDKSTKNLGRLLTPPIGVVSYGRGPGMYVWLHPFFDDYHEHIEIGRGWTYKVKATAPFPDKAQQLINDLHLKDIEKIEDPSERVKLSIIRLSRLSMKCMKKGNYRRAETLLEKSIEIQEESAFG